MWELDHKEGWTLKNLCFWTVVMGKNFESPLDSKEIKPVNLKGNQSWTLIEGLMLRLQCFGHLIWRADFIGKHTNSGELEGKGRRKQDEMVGLHQQLNGHKFKQTLRNSEGQEDWHVAIHGVTKSQTWLNNWTTTNTSLLKYCTYISLEYEFYKDQLFLVNCNCYE